MLTTEGLLILYKDEGMTSQRAVTRVRHLFGASKAGHTGTLDPMATGVLPILLAVIAVPKLKCLSECRYDLVKIAFFVFRLIRYVFILKKRCKHCASFRIFSKKKNPKEVPWEKRKALRPKSECPGFFICLNYSGFAPREIRSYTG